ncbi:MAG: hypothetical protein AAF763_06365 [Pseudomonadota bacterium]
MAGRDGEDGVNLGGPRDVTVGQVGWRSFPCGDTDDPDAQAGQVFVFAVIAPDVEGEERDETADAAKRIRQATPFNADDHTALQEGRAEFAWHALGRDDKATGTTGAMRSTAKPRRMRCSARAARTV